MKSDSRKVCGNCAWWNFKLGGHPDGKEWGECTNPKYYDALRISTRLINLDGRVNGTEDYLAFTREISNYIRVQQEENSFGCIHFESEPVDNEESMVQ